MDYGSEQYRDCMRDVLAMTGQAIVVQAGGLDRPGAAEGLAVLQANADTGNCLTLAVSMLASTWLAISEARALESGVPADEELAAMFAVFRESLC
jgi:hypothetical protein